MYYDINAIKKIEKDLEQPYTLTKFSNLIIKELKNEGIVKKLSKRIDLKTKNPEDMLCHDMYYDDKLLFWVLSEYFKDVDPSMLCKSACIREMALVLLLKKYNLNQKFEKSVSWKREGTNLSEYLDLDLCDPTVYEGEYNVDFYFDDKYLCSDKISFCGYEKRYDIEKMYRDDFYEMIYISDDFANALIDLFLKEIGLNKDELITNNKIKKLEQQIQEYKNEIDRLKNSAVKETNDEPVKEEKPKIKVPRVVDLN